LKLWEITYLDQRYGTRHRYMGIGFKSVERAENELRLIKKERKKGFKRYRNYFKIKPIIHKYDSRRIFYKKERQLQS